MYFTLYITMTQVKDKFTFVYFVEYISLGLARNEHGKAEWFWLHPCL